jgi:ABC-type amino acid transport substrate-binding protein
VQTAFNELKASGAYHTLIGKWGLTDEEITLIDRRANYA